MSKTHKITQLKKRIAELEREKSYANAPKDMVCLYMCISGLTDGKAFHNKYLVPEGSPVAKDIKTFIEMCSHSFSEDIEEIVNDREL